jgi:hypothetical protein
LRKFLTRTKLRLLISGIIVIGVITAAGNIFLAVDRGAIDKAVKGYFTHEISLGRMIYVFPDRIFLKNIVIHKPAASPEKTEFTLSKMAVRFSLRRLIFGG